MGRMYIGESKAEVGVGNLDKYVGWDKAAMQNEDYHRNRLVYIHR